MGIRRLNGWLRLMNTKVGYGESLSPANEGMSTGVIAKHQVKEKARPLILHADHVVAPRKGWM